MRLNVNSVELIAQWCGQSEAISDIRAKARSNFFGYDETGTAKYMVGAEDLNTRERRFLGWFAFFFRLPDGRHPSEMAAESLFKEADLDWALDSIRGTRYVLAVVTMVVPGKRVYLQLEEEEFEVGSKHLSPSLRKDDVICAHILPVGRNRWVLGPGWLTWPVHFGTGMRANLKQLQLNPIEVERFVQRRSRGKENPNLGYPSDKTLQEAVTRMTEAAKGAGKDQLVRSVEGWKNLVVGYMLANNLNQFSRDIIRWVGKSPSTYELNRWLSLSTNIWNNVPQPDRGNRSAHEIISDFNLPDQGHGVK